MVAGTTSAYRSRKRPLNVNGRPCNPRVRLRRRLFPADVNRPAAKVHRGSLSRRRLLLVQTAALAVTAAVTAYCLEARRRGCSDQELAPIIESLGSIASDLRASAPVGAPVGDEADPGRVN